MRSRSFAVLLVASVALCAGCGGDASSPGRPVNLFNATELRTALEQGAEAGATADSGPAQIGEPTGWATMRGVFKLRGAAPERTPESVGKDQDVCLAGGHRILSEQMVVSPNGGIRDVVIYLTTPIADDSGEAEPKFVHASYNFEKNPQRREVVFDQKKCVFLSHVFAAQVGQTILIKNSDPIGHNTNLSTRTAASFNQTIPANSGSPYVPDKAERDPFDVSCSIHDWMKAKMIFRDNPYFAVTNENGEFEIANIPAGVPLEFRVWQEKLRFLTKVTFTPKGGAPEEQTWKKGAMKVTLEPDAPHEFEVAVDASLIK
jgi:hypothetical protein